MQGAGGSPPAVPSSSHRPCREHRRAPTWLTAPRTGDAGQGGSRTDARGVPSPFIARRRGPAVPEQLGRPVPPWPCLPLPAQGGGEEVQPRGVRSPDRPYCKERRAALPAAACPLGHAKPLLAHPLLLLPMTAVLLLPVALGAGSSPQNHPQGFTDPSRGC